MEKRPRARSTEFTKAINSDDRLRALKSMRKKLAAAIEESGPRDMAPLMARLQSVMVEISELEVPAVDEVAQIRDRRRARAAG